jgi:hypothetical protein
MLGVSPGVSLKSREHAMLFSAALKSVEYRASMWLTGHKLSAAERMVKDGSQSGNGQTLGIIRLRCNTNNIQFDSSQVLRKFE